MRAAAAALALACAPLLAACAAAPTEAEVIPGSRVTLEDLFFLAGEDRIYRFGAPTRLCITGSWRREYRGAGISRITGQAPFDALETLPASCPVSLLGPQDRTRIGSARIAGTPSCRIAFTAEGSRLHAVEARVLDAAPDSYRECVYRMALFVEGYNGAATLERDRLFIDTNRTIFAGERTIVGESVPWVVHQLRILCRGISPTDNLSRADLRRPDLCRKEL